MYKVIIKPRAEKELLKLPRRDYERVTLRIKELAENPKPRGTIKLKTRDNYRLRAGDFRIIFDILEKQKTVEVLYVLRRSEKTYKNL